jgi:hypothetical protein
MSCPGIPFEKALPFFAALHCTEDPNWEGSGSLRGQEIYIPLMLCPWIRPAAPLDRAVTDCNSHRRRRTCQLQTTGRSDDRPTRLSYCHTVL